MRQLPRGRHSTSGDGTGDTSGEVQQTSGGEVNVYNWGEYIDESVLEDFEEATGIHVNYQMYDSNETMYGKIAGGRYGLRCGDPLRLYDRPDDRGGHAGAPEF